MTYSISVICFNRLALTKRCLGLVLATMPDGDSELIITDNGSNEEVQKYIASLPIIWPNVRIIRNATNRGVIKPKNEALLIAEGEYFLSLDNDCIPSPGWIQRLCKPMQEDPTIAQVGRNGGFRTLTAQGVGVRGGQVDYIDGSCFAVRTSVALELGLCDEAYEFAYCEDSDFSLRLRRAGHRITTVNAGVQHEEHGTAASMNLRKYWTNNHRTFMGRWGQYLKTRTFGHPGEPT